jgi:hypothetical protein
VLSAIRSNLEVMELLPDNLADVNAVEGEGRTALIDAMWGAMREGKTGSD